MLDIKPLVLLAQLVNFAILMWVLNRFLFRPIKEALKQREETIRSTLDDVENQKKAIEALQREYDERIKNIELELQEMKREAIKEAQNQKVKIIAEARAEAEKIVEKGRLRIENDSLVVLDSLRTHIVELTIKTVKSIVRREMTEEEHLKLIDEIVSEAEKLPWQKK